MPTAWHRSATGITETLTLWNINLYPKLFCCSANMKAIESFRMKCKRRILGIGGMILSVTLRSVYALVSHLCLTGLPEVAMPSSDMWQECQITLQHTRPCYTKSSYRSVDPQTLHGNVHQVDHVPDGPTNSAATTTMFPLRLCGGKPLVTVTRERRYGPSWLRVNDDDDDMTCSECDSGSYNLAVCMM